MSLRQVMVRYAVKGQNPLSDVQAFKEFQDGIADRCAEAPAVTELREIGSFRFRDR